MAANRFATMLQKNTNKITRILVYAVLEWILIVLLLINSMFSRLIVRFAEVFGLQPPFPWCTRLDHIFSSGRRETKHTHRGFLCEFHGNEISKLGYCASNHRLAEPRDMCGHCLSSKPEEFQGFSNYFAVFQNDEEQVVGQNGVANLSCSCCGVSLDNTLFSSCCRLLTTLSWDVYKCVRKENLITMEGDLYDGDLSDNRIFNFDVESCDNDDISQLDKTKEVEENGGESNSVISVSNDEMKESEAEEEKEEEIEVLEMDVGLRMENVEEKLSLIMEDKSVQACIEEDSSLDISTKNPQYFLDYSGHRLVPVELVDLITEESQRIYDFQKQNHENVKDGDYYKGSDDQVGENEDLALKNISESEELDFVLDVDINMETNCKMVESLEMGEEENSLFFHAKDSPLVTDDFKELNIFPAGQFVSEDIIRDVQETNGASGEMHLDFYHDSVRKTEKYPEEIMDGGVTIQQLKSVINAKRKTLEALYVELDEERSSSEVAANEAMAMINRLQGEKAAIQMEAFQYHRMMEEQSEYNQEALELLNNLVVRREKEKRDLKTELEACKWKVLNYETKEMTRVWRKSNGSTITGVSSSFCMNSENCDRCISSEDFSANFECERLSIIWKLQALEEKLVAMDDNSERQSDSDENVYFSGHHQSRQIGGWKGKFSTGNTKLGTEEVLVQEMSETLDVDREHFKHCLSSVKECEKAMKLLQGIIQHLRDLRNMAVCVRNY